MAGNTRMYTSGWPKNQNRCCHNSGSPPPSGMKKWVPNMRSKTIMASAEVSTGRASSNRMATINSDQMVSGMRNRVMPGARMLMMVVM